MIINYFDDGARQKILNRLMFKGFLQQTQFVTRCVDVFPFREHVVLTK